MTSDNVIRLALIIGVIIGVALGYSIGDFLCRLEVNQLKEDLALKIQEYDWLKELADYWKKGGRVEMPTPAQEFMV